MVQVPVYAISAELHNYNKTLPNAREQTFGLFFSLDADTLIQYITFIFDIHPFKIDELHIVLFVSSFIYEPKSFQ